MKPASTWSCLTNLVEGVEPLVRFNLITAIKPVSNWSCLTNLVEGVETDETVSSPINVAGIRQLAFLSFLQLVCKKTRLVKNYICGAS